MVCATASTRGERPGVVSVELLLPRDSNTEPGDGCLDEKGQPEGVLLTAEAVAKVGGRVVGVWR